MLHYTHQAIGHHRRPLPFTTEQLFKVERTTLVATYNVLKRGTSHSWLLAQNSADFIHESAETACVVLRLLE